MQKITTFAALAAFLGLAACGDSMGEQALIGGGVGAGTALVLDADPLAGAAVGAGANVLYCDRNPRAC